MLMVWLGALSFFAGSLVLVGKAVWKGPMSRADRSPADDTHQSLEPPGPGISVFALSRNWPGLALMGLGAVLLLLGGVF